MAPIGKNDRTAQGILIALAVLTAVSFLPGWGAIVLDDEQDILNNLYLHRGIISALEKAPFRVVTYFTYWVNVSAPGAGPFSLHMVNIILHILVGLILYLTLKRMIEGEKGKVAGLAGAGFFLLNPFMGSSVLYISARPAILVSFGSVLATWGTVAYLRSARNSHLAAALAGGLIALFSKETGLAITVIIATMALQKSQRRRLAAVLLPLFIVTAIYILLRMGHVVDLGDRGPDAPSPKEYLWTQMTIIPLYLRKYFWPINMGLDWDVRVRRGALEPAVISSFVFLAMLFASAGWLARRSPVALFFIIWIPLSLLVESSIIPLADLAFDHRFYFAGVGMAALLGIISGALWERYRGNSSLIYIGLIAAVCLALLTVNRSLSWSSNVGAWREAVRVAPNSFRARYNLGHNLLENRNFSAALPQLDTAIKIGGKAPMEDAMALNARGLVYIRRGAVDPAISDFTRAAELWPSFGDALLHLGVAYILKGMPDEAIEILQRAQLLLPDEPKVEMALQKARAASEALHGASGADITPK